MTKAGVMYTMLLRTTFAALILLHAISAQSMSPSPDASPVQTVSGVPLVPGGSPLYSISTSLPAFTGKTVCTVSANSHPNGQPRACNRQQETRSGVPVLESGQFLIVQVSFLASSSPMVLIESWECYIAAYVVGTAQLMISFKT